MPTVEERLEKFYAKFPIDAEHLESVHYYQQDGYKALNRFRRGQLSPQQLQGEERTAVLTHAAHLDKVLGSRIPMDVTVYRGVRHIPNSLRCDEDELESLVGEVRVLPGYVSTSLDPEIASRFTKTGYGGPRGVITLEVPKDSRGLWLPPFSVEDHVKQKELLLPHATEILVNSVTAGPLTGTFSVEAKVV